MAKPGGCSKQVTIKPITALHHNNWHFIFLDSVQENNGGYIALLDDEQFTWLEQELEANKEKMHLYRFSYPHHFLLQCHVF